MAKREDGFGVIVERLPKVFRTRRGFSMLIGILTFAGHGGWDLIQGEVTLRSFVFSVVDGLGAFLFFWFVFSRLVPVASRVIFISGPLASGKSTAGEVLRAILRVRGQPSAIVESDRFYMAILIIK
jgi:hypothetical protein